MENIIINGYKLVKCLGQGNFGVVMKMEKMVNFMQLKKSNKTLYLTQVNF